LRPIQRGLTIAILVGMLAIPLLAALSAFEDYQQLRSLGQDAVHHLLAAKEALIPSQSTGGSCSTSGASTHPTPTPKATATPAAGASGSSDSAGVPDAAHLATAHHELLLAQHEFRQLADLLDRPNPTLALAGNLPSVGSEVTTVRQVVYVGDDAATIGLNLVTAATPLLTRLHNGALASVAQPLITSDEAAQIRSALVSSLSLLKDLMARVSTIDASRLPITACQRSEYVYLTNKLPEVQSLIAQAPSYFDTLMWLVGVDHQRQFLLQTMDRSELRPTGGFTGDYGVVQISGGRLQPFTLRDVDGVYLNTPYNYRPPAVYSWWPFPRWGLRDSNLSPDFPTTARMNITLFEGIQHIWKTIGLPDPNLDGVIQLTITPLAHVLLVTGPITVPKYNEVITADNLEAKIHYYQQDFGAIAKEQALSPEIPTTPRKRFTYIVSQLLESRVRHMSLGQLLSLGKLLLNDVKAHEIQVYVTNPQVESFLVQQGYATALNTTPGEDSLMMDQANTSVSKATSFIDVSLHDTVTLDSKGGATHKVTVTFVNNIHNQNAYGFTTYRDYVRIYVPPQAKLEDANGFDTGRPVCWVAPPWNPQEKQPPQFKALPPCSSIGGFFQDRSLVCPAGFWGPGPRSNDAFGGDGKTDMPVDDTGYPTNYASDVAGRAMFGGYVTVPNYCTATLTLTYFVPNMALPSSAVGATAPAYTYLVERQAGTYINANVNIQPASSVAGETNTPVHYKGTLSADVPVVVPRSG
jgi:hypothetical protein